MKLLLDTHVWLWGLTTPSRLARRVFSALEDPQNELWLSPISVWEARVLCEKGKLESNGDAWLKIAASVESGKFTEAAFTNAVAMEVARVRLPQRDPADRFLVATARVYGLTLVTADAHLLQVPGLSVLSAR